MYSLSGNTSRFSQLLIQEWDFCLIPVSYKHLDVYKRQDYIDIYDMTQAVEDGATRPVYYESRVIHLKLDENSRLTRHQVSSQLTMESFSKQVFLR